MVSVTTYRLQMCPRLAVLFSRYLRFPAPDRWSEYCCYEKWEINEPALSRLTEPYGLQPTCKSHDFQQSIAPLPEVKQRYAIQGILWWVAWCCINVIDVFKWKQLLQYFSYCLWCRFSLILFLKIIFLFISYINVTLYILIANKNFEIKMTCSQGIRRGFEGCELHGQLIYVFFSQFPCVVFWWQQAILMQPLGQG